MRSQNRVAGRWTCAAAVVALTASTSAWAVDAKNPAYEADVYRARRDVATIGLVVSTLGAASAGAGLGLDAADQKPGRFLEVEGAISMGTGAIVTSSAALAARAYPLDGKPSGVPGYFSLGFSGLTGVGLVAYAFTDDADAQDILLYGSVGTGAAATVFGLVQLAADGSAWNARHDKHGGKAALAIAPWTDGRHLSGLTIAGGF